MRNANKQWVSIRRLLSLTTAFCLLFIGSAPAAVDFNWPSLFILVGSAGSQTDVPDEIEVWEDPPSGDGVTIDYKFLGAGMLVTKKQIKPTGKKTHEPFQDTIDHFNAIIGGGKILMDPPNLKSFLNKFIGMAKYGGWSSKDRREWIAAGSPPPSAPPSRGGGIVMPIIVSGSDLEEPGERIYEAFSMFAKGWKVVQPISDIMGDLNAKKHQTCDSCKNCPDSCGSCYDETVTDPYGCTSTVEHHCHNHPCIKFDDAAKAVEENIIENNGHDHPFYSGSSIKYKIKVKDRTPPHIFSALPIPPGDELPLLFGDPMGPKAFTGDFNKIGGLKVDDNDSDKIFCQFALHRQMAPDDPAVWELATGAEEVDRDIEANHVFIPNDSLGEMGYSLFAWDQKDNGNPGMTSVVEHQPQICYGIQSLGFPSLTWTDDFPVKFSATDSAGLLACIGSNKFGKGKMIIDDNDWPNLVIQLVNKRDRGMSKSVLCFPPPIVDPAQRPPTIDSDGASIARLSPPEAIISYDDLQHATASAYIRVLRAEGNNCPADPNFGGFMNDPIDPAFLKKNFRVESPDVSDNLPDGTPDLRPETMGQRMGYGNRLVVQCQEPLVEDVEYEVHVWAEDNVKWIRDNTGRVIHPPYTGIQKLEVTVNDPKQRPPLNVRFDSGGETMTFWMEKPIQVVFREPVTTSLNRGAGETSWDGTFPSIEAKAWDFKGNQRSLKVYFNVTDELSRIRVLEQKHQKN